MTHDRLSRSSAGPRTGASRTDGADAVVGRHTLVAPVQAAMVPGRQSSPAAPAAAARTSGQPLPATFRKDMERAFGADFADVRVHQGPHVEEVGAQAYAQGSDLHFAPGAYDPSSPAGRELIGHELTHVVQQRAGVVTAPQGKDDDGPAINADPSLEAEADRLGAAAARGEVVNVMGTGHGVQPKLAAGAVIQLGNGGGKESRRERGSGEKERDKQQQDEDQGLSNSERRRWITSVFDRLKPIALRIAKQQPKGGQYDHLRLWSERAIERDALHEALELALEHPDAEALLTELVLVGVCDSFEEARQILWAEYKRRTSGSDGVQGGNVNNNNGPGRHLPRLHPDLVAPTQQELKEHQKKYNFRGGNDQEENTARKELDLRTVVAQALDALLDVATMSTHPAPQIVDLEQVIEAARTHYVGPTEEGHEIWVRFQSVLTELCTQAQLAGYPIWDPAVQAALAQVANALASYSSVGSWIGNRDFRR